MSSLIRREQQTEGQGIRTLSWDAAKLLQTGPADSAQMRQPNVPSVAEQEEVGRWEIQIAALEARLEAQEREHASALESARRAGREEALRTFERDEKAANAILEKSLATLEAELRSGFVNAEILAAQLVELCIGTVFVSPDRYVEQVTEALAKQMETLRSELIVSVRVSREDFGDRSDIENLRQRFGHLGFEIGASTDVAKGACRIDLKLGHLDLNLPIHWEAVRAELLQLSGRTPS